eukprot:TRINITY_DN4621_c0_g2_i1.p1 TRINITY_DN4621_c0_g2~~TRINITY_DN4621_c0_g2_i1.p1  ORF type:complete len:120 (+),score=18.24 TRINITY_DN4621_c0_g2_i1:43-360(+)
MAWSLQRMRWHFCAAVLLALPLSLLSMRSEEAMDVSAGQGGVKRLEAVEATHHQQRGGGELNEASEEVHQDHSNQGGRELNEASEEVHQDHSNQTITICSEVEGS